MVSHRVGRLAGELQKELALILDREIQDPRLDFVSVANIEIAPDGCSARVHISSMNNEPRQKADIAAALESAKGYIRRELGRRLKTRMVPELYFQVDDSIAYAVRMMGVIDKQIAEDQAAAVGRPPLDPGVYKEE